MSFPQCIAGSFSSIEFTLSIPRFPSLLIHPSPSPFSSLSTSITGIHHPLNKFTESEEEKMMHMTLYWGKEVTLLFDSWKTDSWLSYSFTLLFCFFLSLFYQHLEARRLNFKLRSIPRPSASSSSSDGQHFPINAPLNSWPPKVGPGLWVRVASSLLFGVNSAIGYFIMLAIMTYNGGVFVAVVSGLCVGYFLFRSCDFGDGEEGAVAVESNACSCS